MNALAQPVPKPSTANAVDRTVGAVVIGGDYQGLGIVRSLGRLGVPVCVVDDELSISRYSRYCTKFVKLANLHNERVAAETACWISGNGSVWMAGCFTLPGRNSLPPCRAIVQSSAKCSEFQPPIGKA